MPLSEERKTQLDELFQGNSGATQSLRNDRLEQALYEQQQKQSRDRAAHQEQQRQATEQKQYVEQSIESRGGPANPEDRLPIGSTVGSIAGGIAGSAVGGLPGALLGAGAGGVVGDFAQQGVEAMVGSPHAPRSASQSVRSALHEGALGSASELGGRAVVAGATKVLAPFAKTVLPEAREATQFLQPYLTQPLLPAEATGSRTLDILENVAESSLIGGGAIKAFKENRAQVFEDIADEMVSKIGPKARPDEIGEALMHAVEQGKKVAQAPAKILYNTVVQRVAPTKATVTVLKDSPSVLVGPNGKVLQVPVQEEIEVGGAKVSTQSMKLLTKPLEKIAKEINRIEGGTAGDDLVASIQGLDPSIGFAAAQSLRSRLIAAGDKMSIDNKGAPAIGVTRRLVKALNGEMEKSLQAEDPHAFEMWREANRIYREGEKTFNNRLIRGLVKKGMEEFGDNPEAIAKTIFQPGKVTSIARIKEAVDVPTWKKLQSFALQDLLAKSELNGVVTGKKLDGAMFGRTGYGKEMMEAVFEPGQVDRFKAFSNALRISQEKQSEGTGRMLIQLTQGGALLNMAGELTGVTDTGTTMESGAILLGPAIIAQLLTHPGTANWLTRGVRMPAKAPQAGAMFGHILSAAFPRPSQEADSTSQAQPVRQEPARGRMSIYSPEPMQ